MTETFDHCHGMHTMARIAGLFEKSSHLTQEAIALYVDALKLKRTNQLPEELLNHVGDCEYCKTQVVELYSLVEAENHAPAESHPYFDKEGQVKSRQSWPVYRIAAILALAIGLGGIIYYVNLTKRAEDLTTQAESSKPTESSVDSTATARKAVEKFGQPGKELYARNFTESPNLENLVGSEMRSGAPQVLSPLNGAVVGQEILFRWEGEYKGPFVLKILTNTEKVCVNRTLNDPHLTIRHHLLPGVYYWKLESRGELLYVGKFLVK